ncbi:HTH-type transcriptional regulator IscR [subsurface metagenome]|uniref:Rrf2 family transcriptional regulator n=1 Tax=marine sediment metagenome TaxID=412755 RepID=X1L7J5_9ZZZZ
MKITTKTRYALRTLVDLANQPKGKVIPLIEIAKRQSVKPKYLEQIFLKLRQAKLIKSKKGPGGGYFISRAPDSIKISEIMKAVGESKAPVFCVDKKKYKHCSRIKRCPTRPYWKKLNKIIGTFFDTHTLSDLCKERKCL